LRLPGRLGHAEVNGQLIRTEQFGDGHVTMGLKLWDLAPASVILQAAGGIVTDSLGAAWTHSSDGCIASNATIHGRLITSFGPLNALRRMKAGQAARG
jgi:3'-phosphoadenosine 5'-phosphosulfate (PAPS) 3'-phosphatase